MAGVVPTGLFGLASAPVFRPSEEDFLDFGKYVTSIRERAERHGICKIVPPPSFAPALPIDAKVARRIICV